MPVTDWNLYQLYTLEHGVEWEVLTTEMFETTSPKRSCLHSESWHCWVLVPQPWARPSQVIPAMVLMPMRPKALGHFYIHYLDGPERHPCEWPQGWKIWQWVTTPGPGAPLRPSSGKAASALSSSSCS